MKNRVRKNLLKIKKKIYKRTCLNYLRRKKINNSKSRRLELCYENVFLIKKKVNNILFKNLLIDRIKLRRKK